MMIGCPGSITAHNGFSIFPSVSVQCASSLHRNRTGSNLRVPSRRSNVIVSAQVDDEDQPPSLGDWRQFRSQLLRENDARQQDNSRQTPENLALLRAQNEYLAAEGLWAAPTETIVAGNLVLATPEAPELSGDARVAQLVILLLSHGPRGSEGVMLNRPSFACVEDLLGWGWPAEAPTDAIIRAFSSSVVYLGGWFAPNKIARQKSIILHGQADLPGSTEVSPGIYVGGQAAAAARVLEGKAAPQESRFFTGSVNWAEGQLEAERAAGLWRLASASRPVALKHCFQLPVPLWLEVHRLMGADLRGTT